MEFRILGPLEVVDRGRAVPLGAPKQRALLAALLLNPNRVVSTDRLIDALWPTRPPAAAANALQFHVSQLRKLLGDGAVVVTQEPGYLIEVDAEQLDLLRFERLVAEAEGAEAPGASRLLTEALGLWRGMPLADLSDDAASRSEIHRLEASRLAALELRIEADLTLGRYSRLVPELEALVHEHPLHERFGGALMQALYGVGRQADALDVYRRTRQAFVAELGIEPSPGLRELEQAILRQDLELAPVPDRRERGMRSILVVAGERHHVGDLLAIAAPLSKHSRRELILARLTTNDYDLAAATAELTERRDELAASGVPCRVAAYTTSAKGAEAARLATEQLVDLVLAEAPPELLSGGPLAEPLGDLLELAPCDVGLLAGGAAADGGPVVTPFGGAEHDWSAIELAAGLAASLDTSLRLLGTDADPALRRRDASRLLARASLLVQQVVGIVTEPVRIAPGDRGVLEASAGARVLVLGLSERWRDEGIGSVRQAIAAAADAPGRRTRPHR